MLSFSHQHFSAKGEAMAISAKRKTTKKASATGEKYRPLPPDIIPEKGDYLLRLSKSTFFLVKGKSIGRAKDPILVPLTPTVAKKILYSKYLEENASVDDPPTIHMMSCR